MEFFDNSFWSSGYPLGFALGTALIIYSKYDGWRK